jgi:hypothetical protein
VLLVLHKRRLRRTPVTVHFIRQWEMSSARPFTCSPAARRSSPLTAPIFR